MDKKYIDTHCHILNFRFIPDKFIKTRAPIREKLLESPFTRWLARLLTVLIPGEKYDELHYTLALFHKDIKVVAEALIQEMNAANIQTATPLMMDLEFASFQQQPEVPYRHQIEVISEIASDYPGRLFPFVMVDPRRPNATETTIRAIEDLGFLGVKVYPPLGYHPYHNAFFNKKHVNQELKKLYEYCEWHEIPITTHCSNGGAYSSEIMKCLSLRKRLTRPSNWRLVLEDFPKLRLNLAHFGGDFLEIDDENSWAYEIRKMVREYENVYTDLSYHDEALKKVSAEKYYQLLNSALDAPVVSKKILFGTDWSMPRHTWSVPRIVETFEENLTENKLRKIMVSNPVRFLCPEGEIPTRITAILAKRGKTIPKTVLDFWEMV